MSVVSKSKKSLKKFPYRYVVDATVVAEDDIFNVPAFEKFLNERIKVENKTGNLKGKVIILREEAKIVVLTKIPFSGRYLKYLTKKFLKKHQLRDWVRVIATSMCVYEMRFFNVELPEESEEE